MNEAISGDSAREVSQVRARVAPRSGRCPRIYGVLVIVNFAIRGSAFASYFKYCVGGRALFGFSRMKRIERELGARRGRLAAAIDDIDGSTVPALGGA